MIKYCENCKGFHDENELCPKYKEQLKKHPEWIKEATEFTIAAGSTALIQTQALESISQVVNKVAGTNLSYEGTNQAIRDIQVFAKLNSDSFSKSGYFNNAETAKQVYESSSEGFKRYLRGRLNGTGQEIDWLRYRQQSLDQIVNKASLPDGNTVGYDGVVHNRFTGKVVEKVTVKAAEGSSGIHTNAKDIIEAITKGNLETDATAFVVEGTPEEFYKQINKLIEEAVQKKDVDLVNKLTAAKENINFIENGTTNEVEESTKRLVKKIKKGQAHTTVTADAVLKKTAQGAIIGAAVSLTISGITNFIKYKNGEISADVAFRVAGEDTAKGAIVGGAMAGITMFLPGGPIGFVAGVAISIYIGETVGNLLDEVFGKGFYEQLLNAEGYICGIAKNMGELLKEFAGNVKNTERFNQNSRQNVKDIFSNRQKISAKAEKTKKLLGDL